MIIYRPVEYGPQPYAEVTGDQQTKNQWHKEKEALNLLNPAKFLCPVCKSPCILKKFNKLIYPVKHISGHQIQGDETGEASHRLGTRGATFHGDKNFNKPLH